MKSVFKVLALTAACLCMSSMAFGQWTLFTVDDDALPGGTTYPTLAGALATAATYPGGPHKIMILAGDYYDVNMTVANVDEIYGDPAAAPGDIVFHGASNFLTLISGVTIQNMTITGYDDALRGPAAGNCTIQDIVFDDNDRAIVFWAGGSDNNVVDDCQFLNHTTLAVYFDGLGNSVTDCTFDTNTGYGVYMGGGTGTVTGCSFVNGGNFAVQLLGNGNFVRNCTFDTNAGYGVYFNGGNNSLDSCLFTANTGYGVICAVGSGVPINAVANNCFIGNNGGGVQGFDGTNLNWWSHNYWSDDAGGAYALDGGGGNSDFNPWRRENQVTGPTTVEVLNPLHVDLNWVAPACSAGDPQLMAAYEFTVTYDTALFEFVGAGNDDFYVGVPPEALYTGPTVDETAGTIVFAGANFTTPGEGDGRLGYVDFVAKATSASTTISVGSDYRDENNNPIPAGSQSLTLAVTDTQQAFGTVVFNDPIGNMTFSNSYSMEFSGIATDNYCLSQVWYRVVEGYIGWTLIKNLSGTSDSYGPVTVSMAAVPEGGPYTLEVLFRDCTGAGPNDFSVLNSFNVDKTGPNASGVTITDSDGCADAGYTSSELCNVSWTDDGSGVDMELALTGFPVPFVAYANPTTYTFPSTETTYTLHVRLRDVYGNAGGYSAGTTIILDKTAPAPNTAWLVANPTPAKTNTDLVSGDAYLDAPSGALYAKAAEDGVGLGCGDPGWATIAGMGPSPRFSFDLSDADGVKTVVFASRDAAGNIGTTSATIELDRTAPLLSAFDIYTLTGKPCASTNGFDAIYSFAATDVVKLQYSYDDAIWGDWVNPIPQSPDTAAGGFAAPGDGWKKVYGRLVDNIGNAGASMVDSLYVDMTPPSLATAVPDDITPTADPDPTVFPNTTNEATFRIQMTGLSTDVEQLAISEDGGTNWTYIAVATGGAATFDYDYAWTTPAECSWYYGGQVKTVDCAGNESAPVAFSPTGVWFDFTAPIITAFTGPASTNNVNVNLTITATDNCSLYLMRLAQGSLVGVPWVAFNAAPTFTLSGGDGTKTVNLEVADYGGNIASSSVTIDLDATVPVAGTFIITSANPDADPGYTSTLIGNTFSFTPVDGDIVWMHIENANGTGDIIISPFTSPATGTLNPMVDPVAPYPDVAQIRYRLRDDANNTSGWFYVGISYNPINPPAPAVAGGVPGGSLELNWAKVADAKAYQIRYNFTNQNPAYTSGVPPFPGTMMEGILEVAQYPDTSYVFEGPQDDLFAFGIWTLNKYGLWSLAPNQQVLENNYRLGDYMDVDQVIGSDGCLDFIGEFFSLSMAYGTDSSQGAYNAYLDFAPTSDSTNLGYAKPDGNVNFEDLVIFALNYKWSRAQEACEGVRRVSPPPLAASGDITISAELPSYVRGGEEFSVPISISDGAGVAGYHLVFDYDREALELVSVNPGTVYEGVDKTFFYHDDDAAGIDISSAVLNDAGLTGGEIAVATFRTRTSGSFTLEDALLDVRDWNNQRANVSFNVTAKTGSLPTEYALSQNYPNPFNPTTTIELAMPQAGQYRLTIYNVIGQVVDVFEGYADAGYMTFNWDASRQASGVYLYKVTVGDFSATRKMVLLK